MGWVKAPTLEPGGFAQHRAEGRSSGAGAPPVFSFVSFATFCEILNRAVVTMHGWLKLAAFGTGQNAATLRGSSVKISNHLQKVAKAQPLLPAEPAGLPAVARSAKEGSFLRVLCDLL
jgi:hypothetical protein